MRSQLLSVVALAAVSACSSSEPARPPLGPVTLQVDALGITHVYARTDEGAMWGAGYAMARDRLFQMEINRRRAQGRLAELFGTARVKDDIGARAFGFVALGAADVARMRRERPTDAGLLDAWARGVNARIAEVRSGKAPRPYGLGKGPSELDFVPDDWTAEDGATVGKLLGFGLSSTLDSEVLASAVLALAPDFAARYPLVLPAFDAFPLPTSRPTSVALPPPAVRALAGRPRPDLDVLGPLHVFGEDQGSNNWAITADRTDNGRPYLAGDPHQQLGSPIRLWPVHMSSVAGGGSLDVIGFAFVGTPSVELGHNGRVGWTATTAFADVMDILAVERSDDGKGLLVGGQVLPLVERDESIKIRKADGTFGEEVVTVGVVPGKGVLLPPGLLPVPPVLLTSSKDILLLWTGFAPTLEGAAYLAMDRARSVDEWEKAVDLIEVGAQNFVGADQKDVSYHVSLNLPDRGAPSAHPMPWRLLPGKSPDVLWSRGFLPADRLPRLRPKSGYIATANTDPFGFTADGDVENDPFYYGAFFANGMRLSAIQKSLDALLAGGKKVTRADMEVLQADTRSPVADLVVPRLVDAWKKVDTLPALAAWKGRADLGRLVDRLSAWDRRMSPTSGDAVVALGLEWFAAKRVVLPVLGDLLFEGIAEKSPPFVVGALVNVLEARFAKADSFVPDGREALLLAALADTQAWLVARFGSDDPTKFALRDLLAAEFPTPFGRDLEVGRTPIGGSFDTINVAPAPFFEKKGSVFTPRVDLACTEMAMYRMVIGFDDDGVPRATLDFARGTREDPRDKHFGDRQAEWQAASHVPLWFKKADVDAHTEETVTLDPDR